MKQQGQQSARASYAACFGDACRPQIIAYLEEYLKTGSLLSTEQFIRYLPLTSTRLCYFLSAVSVITWFHFLESSG
jgi:hypothetical protein